MNEQKVAVYSGTRCLYPYMPAAIRSMLANSSVDKIYLYIEDDKFPEWLPDMVETVKVNGEDFFPAGSANFNTYYTYMSMIRICDAKILPESVHKALHMDIDTVVVDDIDEMWDFDLTGMWCGAVHEDTGTYRPNGDKYYNLGVCMFNLDQMRKDGAADQLIEYLNKIKVPYIEQCAMNAVGQDKIVPLPARFNESRVTEYTDNPAIVHFAAIMNWRDNFSLYRGNYLKEYKEMTWEEALRRHELNRAEEPEMEGGGSSWWYACPECHGAVDPKEKRCRHCNKKILWK